MYRRGGRRTTWLDQELLPNQSSMMATFRCNAQAVFATAHHKPYTATIPDRLPRTSDGSFVEDLSD